MSVQRAIGVWGISVCVGVGVARAGVVDFNDGASHLISSSAHERDALRVRNAGCSVLHLDVPASCPAPGAPTTLSAGPGAVMGAVLVFDDSVFELSGGTTRHGVEALGDSTVVVSGGTLEGELFADERGSLQISGGTVSGDESGVDGLATLEMTGGTIVEPLYVSDFAHAHISGGTVASGILAFHFAEVVVSGGTVQDEIVSHARSVVTVVGSGFEIDGQAEPYGGPYSGQLTGTLASTDPIDVFVSRVFLASSVPAPSAPSASLALYADGGSHSTGDDTHLVDRIGVRNSGCGSASSWEAFDAQPCAAPGAATAFTIGPGADFGDAHAYDDSSITVTGGSGWVAAASGAGTVTMSGGFTNAAVQGDDVASVALTGGSPAFRVGTERHAVGRMTGGSAWGLPLAEEHSHVVLSGGTFGHDPSFGPDGGIESWDYGTVTVVGTGFEIDGTPVSNGDVAELSGVLTGSLESGDALDAHFERDPTARIVLAAPPAPVPSPPTVALLNDAANHPLTGPSHQNDLVAVRAAACASSHYPWAPCPAPGAQTQATLQAGGTVRHALGADGSSFDVAGGSVSQGLELADSASTLISSGSIGWGVDAEDLASVSISGGQVGRDVSFGGLGTGTVSGGTILGKLLAVELSQLSVSGGTVGDVASDDLARVTLSGGSVSGKLLALDLSLWSIHGSGFSVDGNPVPDGPLVATSGTLTGTLASGDPLDAEFERDPTAVIAVPEPGRTPMLALGALAMALFRMRTRGFRSAGASRRRVRPPSRCRGARPARPPARAGRSFPCGFRRWPGAGCCPR